ncbi:MAG: hypothetical protein AMXMBFR33_58770 [Candidatus Xenobia bacterium]
MQVNPANGQNPPTFTADQLGALLTLLNALNGSDEGLPGGGDLSGLPFFPGTTTTQMPGQANQAAWQQMMLADQMQAQTIMIQSLAEFQKHQAERNRILRDTQTKIFELQQESTNQWIGTCGKVNKEFSQALMS